MYYVFFCFYFIRLVQILDPADFKLYLIRECHSPPVGCFPVAIFAQFSFDLEMLSLKAAPWAGGCVCCNLHVALCCADPPTWENWMTLQERQPRHVCVQSVVVCMWGVDKGSSEGKGGSQSNFLWGLENSTIPGHLVSKHLCKMKVVIWMHGRLWLLTLLVFHLLPKLSIMC